MTLEQGLARVLRDYELNDRPWLKDVRIRVRKHLLPGFGATRDLATFTRDDIEAYALKRRKGASGVKPAANASINRDLALLRRAFRLAQQLDVWNGLEWMKLREAAPRRGFFEPEELRRLLPCFSFPVHRDVTMFLALTGWRNKSEVFSLQWAQVDFPAKILRLLTSKNGDPRELPFGEFPQLEELLVQRSLDASGPYVFHRNGAPIKSMYKAWRGACARAGLSGRLMHDFRRTAARNLIAAGVTQQDAREITGHRTNAVFERYRITDAATRRATVDKLATFLAGGGKLLGPR